MTPLFAIAGLLLATPAHAAVGARAPTESQLSQALARVRGGTPKVREVRCAPGRAGYVRCTYFEKTPTSFRRWAVLLSSQQGRWTVSEGPIPERAVVVRRQP